MKWIVVTMSADEPDSVAYGTFSSEPLARKFADDYNEEGVRPAYSLMVVELYPVNAGKEEIKEARWENDHAY
jgi:hypothetical protein